MCNPKDVPLPASVVHLPLSVGRTRREEGFTTEVAGVCARGVASRYPCTGLGRRWAAEHRLPSSGCFHSALGARSLESRHLRCDQNIAAPCLSVQTRRASQSIRRCLSSMLSHAEPWACVAATNYGQRQPSGVPINAKGARALFGLRQCYFLSLPPEVIRKPPARVQVLTRHLLLSPIVSRHETLHYTSTKQALNRRISTPNCRFR